jgi:hypothetical protein
MDAYRRRNGQTVISLRNVSINIALAHDSSLEPKLYVAAGSPPRLVELEPGQTSAVAEGGRVYLYGSTPGDDIGDSVVIDAEEMRRFLEDALKAAAEGSPWVVADVRIEGMS